MELDAEIYLSNFPRLTALEIAKSLPVEFASTSNSAADYQDIVIRAAPQFQVVKNVEAGLEDFLPSLTAYAEAIKRSRGVLRLGIFYDLRETVVFPFRLSVEMIKVLSDLNLSIDATGYPCAEESA